MNASWFTIAALSAAIAAMSAPVSELNKQRDELLAPAVTEKLGAVDPLLGEWLTAQRRILKNLESAIAADPAQAESMIADYEYLLKRIAAEIDHARNTPQIDESSFYNVRDFGAKGDGIGDDGDAIRQAVAAAAADTTGKRTVFLPRGRYRIKCTGSRTGNLKLEKLRNLRIVGEPETELLLPGPFDVAVRLNQCDNVGLRNLKLTYLKAPYTVGRIVGFPADDTMRIEIAPGMVDPTDPMFRQAQTGGLMRFHSPELQHGKIWSRLSSIAPHQSRPVVTPAGGRLYDFKVNSHIPVRKNYRLGTQVAFYARTYGNHSIDNADSSRTRLENITINTSSAMAILNNGSNRPFIINCRIEAQPGSPVSTSADGIYLRNLSLGGLIKGNTVRHIGDDFMNIHTIVHPAIRAEGKNIYLKASDWKPARLAPGNRIGLVWSSRGRYDIVAEARIVSCENTGDSLLKLTLDRDFGPVAVASAAGMPDMIILPENQCHGLVITENRFEDGLSRFLAGGHNVLFSGNIIIDKLSHHFFMNICPEKVGVQGGEFASPRNWEFSDNRFITYSDPVKTFIRFAVPVPSGISVASHIKFLRNTFVINRSDMRKKLMDKQGVAYLTLQDNTVLVKDF